MPYLKHCLLQHLNGSNCMLHGSNCIIKPWSKIRGAHGWSNGKASCQSTPCCWVGVPFAMYMIAFKNECKACHNSWSAIGKKKMFRNVCRDWVASHSYPFQKVSACLHEHVESWLKVKLSGLWVQTYACHCGRIHRLQRRWQCRRERWNSSMWAQALDILHDWPAQTRGLLKRVRGHFCPGISMPFLCPRLHFQENNAQ